MSNCKSCLFYNHRMAGCSRIEGKGDYHSCPYHIQFDSRARVCANCQHFFQHDTQGLCTAPTWGLVPAHLLDAACWQFNRRMPNEVSSDSASM